MAQKKLIIGENCKLIISNNQKLTFRDSSNIPETSEIFAPSYIRKSFEEFVPQIYVDYTSDNPSIEIVNYKELNSYLQQDTFEGKDYKNYLETGIVLIKHSRKNPYYENQNYKHLQLPDGAAILWNVTTYGRPQTPKRIAEEENKLPVGKLVFKLDSDIGKIRFKDFLRNANKEWQEQGDWTNKALIFEKIYPVCSVPINPDYSYLFRSQDTHKHNYYFYGIIFRLRKDGSISSSDKNYVVLSKPSTFTTPISYDVKSLNLNILKTFEGMRYVDLVNANLVEAEKIE